MFCRETGLVEQRGDRCERCGKESVPLDLHHVHYRLLGNEQPEDVELLCRECHRGADGSRAAKRSARPGATRQSPGSRLGPKSDHHLPAVPYIPYCSDRERRRKCSSSFHRLRRQQRLLPVPRCRLKQCRCRRWIRLQQRRRQALFRKSTGTEAGTVTATMAAAVATTVAVTITTTTTIGFR